MGVLYARETPQDNFTPVSTMGVGLASQSQAGLMSVPDKVKLDGIDDEKLDGITDYIVEQGTSGIWTYRKWNSGIAECWGVDTRSSFAVTTAYGSIYRTSDLFRIDLPTGLFNTAPAPFVTLGGSGVDMPGQVKCPDATKVQFYWTNPASYTVATGVIQMYIIGTWK